MTFRLRRDDTGTHVFRRHIPSAGRRIRIRSRTLHLHPLIDDQQLDSLLSTGSVYCESTVHVSEHGREVGRGYLEMTGYGERIAIG